MLFKSSAIPAALALLLSACGSSGTSDEAYPYPETTTQTPETKTPDPKTPEPSTNTPETPETPTNTVNNLSLDIRQLDQLEGSHARIEIRLSPVSSLTQRFDYRLLPATALAGRDYQDISGQVEFKAGEQVKELQIPLLSDSETETTESFLIEFSGDTLSGKIQGSTLQIQDQPRIISANLAQIRLNDLKSGQVQAATYGQVFNAGEIQDANELLLINSQQQSLPTQVDVKARHPDGSIRHAIISSLKPKTDSTVEWYLVKKDQPATSKPAAVSPLDLLKQRNINAQLELKLAGSLYQIDLQQALAKSLSQKKIETWLQGPVVNEWLFSAPLTDTAGKTHPHLMARFELRLYQDLQPVRLSVSLENNWTYVPAPGNQQYDLSLTFAGKTVLTETGLVHHHHSRWRKVFWSDANAELTVTPDLAQLLKSGAVPSYDPSLTIKEATLKGYADALTADDASQRFGLMGTGLLNYKMGTTGARPEIGPMPAWTASYLISGDPRARQLMLEHANLAGSWPIHYRDEQTDQPVSVENYPYITLLGNRGDTLNPDTKAYEALPACDLKGACQTVNRRFWSKLKTSTAAELVSYSNEPDSAHQPSQAYLPYLITGDHFYLEEMQFWTNFNLLQTNPHYRGKGKGLVTGQVRGMAWDLRALGEAAYLTPDTDPLKAFYLKTLANNAEFFKQTYADNASDHPLGYLPNLAYGFVISPWMDDFFTWSVGQLVNQGFSDWQPILNWKARFPVGRMTDPGFCWILAPAYHMNAMPGDELTFKILSQTPYKTFAELYDALLETPAYAALKNTECASTEMAEALTDTNRLKAAGQFYVRMQAGEMIGYDGTYAGYSSNLQPALAVATRSSHPDARKAWQLFMQRPKKDNGYSESPQFAIVPLP